MFTDAINHIIDTYNIPFLTAFILGIMTSISPCPLATNVLAVAFISKKQGSKKRIITNGLYYTLGRCFTYTLLSIIIYLGFSSSNLKKVFYGWGDKVLGPALIMIGLVMLDIFKIRLNFVSQRNEKYRDWLSKKGYIGTMLIGAIFALTFCPYSGVIFFTIFIPLVLSTNNPIILPIIYSFGTGIPVIIFSFLIATSMKKIGKIFNLVKTIEKYLRYIVGLMFIITGIYYLRFLFNI